MESGGVQLKSGWRTGLPLMIMTDGEPVFVMKNGDISYHNRQGVYFVGDDDVQKSFRKVCGYSVHSYQNEIKNGFLTIDGNRSVLRYCCYRG